MNAKSYFARKPIGRAILPIRLACGGGACLLGFWAGMPWPGLAGLGLTFCGAMAMGLKPKIVAWDTAKWGWWLAWSGAIALVGNLVLTASTTNYGGRYYALIAWLLAATMGLTLVSSDNASKRRHWRLLGICHAFAGGAFWLADAYLNNQTVVFHTGLLFLGLPLIYLRLGFRLPPAAILAVNTLILWLAVLPVADAIVRPSVRFGPRPELEKAYSYATARKNPAQFARWWGYYLDQWDRMANSVFMPDAEGVLPFRLRPNSRGYLCGSPIVINRRGFRGPEIPWDKGDTYRIVTLGESTTFGCTLNPEDQPWPEVLERVIRENIPSKRPVRVINAGVPAYTLRHNLDRWEKDILPLQPDMIVSYHGYNGLKMLEKCLPLLPEEIPPAFVPRPLHLLAKIEYRWKMARFKAREVVPRRPSPTLANPLESDYARAYEELFRRTQTNGIRLALANFSLAVNRSTAPDVVEFYRAGFPSIRWQIRANAVHNDLVEQLARLHPEIQWVDTRPQLDGYHEKFIDLAHLTQEGRRQLADHVFAGVKGILELDLSHRTNRSR